MSTVATLPREAVEATPRKAMTAARKARIWTARNGLCAWCNKPVEMTGPTVVYDHFIPLAIGGAEDDGNVRPLHASPCDKIKTALDKKQIAKAVRLRKREDGSRRKRRPWFSRGFDKRFHHHMDGTRTPRQEPA